MQTVPTVKVKPWGTGQGDYVEINADDFDPALHTLLDDDKPKRGRPKKDTSE